MFRAITEKTIIRSNMKGLIVGVRCGKKNAGDKKDVSYGFIDAHLAVVNSRFILPFIFFRTSYSSKFINHC